MKLNSSGSPVWQKTYESHLNSSNRGFDIQETLDSSGNANGYIVAGTTIFTGTAWGIWILRLAPDGSLDWQKKYNLSTAGVGSIQQTFDTGGNPNGYILAGSNDYFLTHAWVIKLNMDGSIDWEKTYGNLGANVNCIRQISAGGYILTGYVVSASNEPTDVWVAKIAIDGTIIWQKAYGGDKQDEGYEVFESHDFMENPDGFVVTGFTESFGAGGQDVWVFKLDSNGNIQWQKTYGGPENDVAYSVDQTQSNGYIMVGETWSFGTGGDFWVLKINASGQIPYCSVMDTSKANITEPEIFDYLPYTPGVFIPDPIVTTTSASLDPQNWVMAPICTIAGDLDWDDDVDESDLALFAQEFGKTDCDTGQPCGGDIDNDRDADGIDLSILAVNFGEQN
jgi:hypothetical protein